MNESKTLNRLMWVFIVAAIIFAAMAVMSSLIWRTYFQATTVSFRYHLPERLPIVACAGDTIKFDLTVESRVPDVVYVADEIERVGGGFAGGYNQFVGVVERPEVATFSIEVTLPVDIEPGLYEWQRGGVSMAYATPPEIVIKEIEIVPCN